MADPYSTTFDIKAVNGPRIVTRQELISYEWVGNTMRKVSTVRKFFGDDDYVDTQSTDVIYHD